MNVSSPRPRVDVAIITIREDEFRAALAAFPDAIDALRGRRIYELRALSRGDGRRYVVAIVRAAEQGNTAAQAVANDVLEELEPRWVLVVGIAGARPSEEFSLGDVVVSTRIIDHSVGAALPGGGAELAHGGGPLLPEAERVVAHLPARDRELGAWGAAIAAERPSGDGRTPRFVTGAILSSDLLMRDPERLRAWLASARQALACEMESAGVYRATHDRGVPFLAIRGISDVVGVPRDAKWTAYAPASAAAFARCFLKSGAIPIEDARVGAESNLPRVSAPGPSRVLISFAPQDEALATELEMHCALLRSRGLVTTQRSRAAAPGEDPEQTAAAAFERADLILLLLSSSYFASPVCQRDLALAEARRASGGVVVPVLLRRVDLASVYAEFGGKPWFEGLQRLPRDERAVNAYSDRDEAWTEIAREIRGLAERTRRG